MTLMHETATIHSLDRARRSVVIVTLCGIPLCAILAVWMPAQSMRSYLLAFIFWFGIAGGSLGLLLLHQLVGGNWGDRIHAAARSAAATLPLMVILFIPVALMLGLVYPWSDPGRVHADPLLEHKRVYLNDAFFWWRAAAYFLIWIVTWRVATRQGTSSKKLAAPGLLLFGLTMTFASIDWVMSLEPHWTSPVFGTSFMVGETLLALAFCIIMASTSEGGGKKADDFNDLGNLLLALLMLWGYLAFSQYLIIWSANLPDEIQYYIRRLSGGWRATAWILIIAHFFLPFFLMLIRNNKRQCQRLVLIAGFIILMRLVDVTWLIEPAFQRGRLLGLSIDAAMLIGVGGIWGLAFVTIFQRHSLMIQPVNDLEVRE
jgi:hypothetical protein